MPRSIVVSVGISWGRPGTRTCGISVGRFGGHRWLTQQAVQGHRSSASRERFAAWPAWLATGSRG